MKVSLYVVGDNIETVEYAWRIPLTWLPVYEIPTMKANFADDIIINSILNCASPLFFLHESEAKDYAKSKATILDYDERYLTCPVVCKAEMELINDQLHAISLQYAKIFHDFSTVTTHELNYDIEQDDSLLSFCHPLIWNAKEIKCTKDNYRGNFNELYTPENNFTFFLGNKRGFTPKGQNNTYQLPDEIAKYICEYVTGRKLNRP